MRVDAAEQAAEGAAPDKHGQPWSLRDRNARHEGARPLRRGLILARNPHDSEGSPKVQYADPRVNQAFRALPVEPGGVEAVEPAQARIGVGQLQRQRAQVAVGGEEFGEAADLRRCDGARRRRGSRASKRRDLVLAFLRLERAGAIDQGAAGLDQLDRAVEQPPLQRGERGDVGFALEPGHVGMAADGAGRGAGRIEQHGVERPALPFQRVGGDGLGCKRSRARFSRSAAEPGGRAIDRGDVGAGDGELRGLAAGRGAQVGDCFAAHVAEQPRRQRGGGVLHPPGAFAEARQQRDRAMRERAHRAGRQHAAAQALGPGSAS